MNALLSHADSPIISRLGWTLLHFLWQGALIAAVFGLIRTATKRQSANFRYAAACCSLFLLCCAPIYTFTRSQITFQSPPIAVHADTGAASVNPVSTPVHSTTIRLPASWVDVEAALPWIVIFWLVGVTLLSLRLGFAWLEVQRLRTHCLEPIEQRWLELLEDLKCHLEINRTVMLVKSALIEVPTVIGWLRPMILLPSATLTGLTPEQLESILAHELAHIRRHDYLVNVLQCLVETVLFYHPAVWWISKCMREERELCCDDIAVQICGDRLTYANALFALESLRSVPAGLAMAADGGSLLGRIRRLLGLSSTVQISGWRRATGSLLVVTGTLLILLGTAYTLYVPKMFRSTTRIKIQIVQPWNTSSEAAMAMRDPFLLQTEVETIKSRPVLVGVVQNMQLELNVASKPQDKSVELDAVRLLEKKITVHSIPTSSCIEITAADENPEHAAAIANQIAIEYRNLVIHNRSQSIDSTTKKLKEELKRQNDEINEKVANLEAVRRRSGIDDTGDSLAENKALISHNASLLTEANARFEEIDSKYRNLKQLSEADLEKSLLTVVNDDNLAKLLQAQNEYEQQLAVKTKELGLEHPEVQKLSAALQLIRMQIAGRIQGILKGMEISKNALQRQIEKLTISIESTKAAQVVTQENYSHYTRAKEDLESAQRMRDAISLKITELQIIYAIPLSPVSVIDEAQPSYVPISPRTEIKLALFGLGTFSLVLGLLLLVSRSLASLPPLSKPATATNGVS